MRWIFSVLILLFILPAFAGEIPRNDGISAILQTVDPAKPDTAARAEETLVAYGKDILPDAQAVLIDLYTELADAEKKKQPDRIMLLTAQTTVLDRVIIRLQTGFDWPRLIRMWIEQQYKPDQQAIPDSLPEPVRITDPRVQRAFPEYLLYISRYPQHSEENRIQPPLASNNLFAVKKDMGPGIAGQIPPPRQIILLTDADLLKAFFLAVPKPLLVPGADIDYDRLEAGMKDLAYSWLRLSGELHGDLFFHFTIPAESLTFAISGADDGGYMVRGRAEVVSAIGNTGFIEASVFFNNVALLIDVKEVVKLQSAIRR